MNPTFGSNFLFSAAIYNLDGSPNTATTLTRSWSNGGTPAIARKASPYQHIADFTIDSAYVGAAGFAAGSQHFYAFASGVRPIQLMFFTDGAIKNRAGGLTINARMFSEATGLASSLTSAPTVVIGAHGSAMSSKTPTGSGADWAITLTQAETNVDWLTVSFVRAGDFPVVYQLNLVAAATGGSGGGTGDDGMTVDSTSDFPVTTGWTEVTSAAGKTFRFGFSSSDEHLFWKVASSQPGGSERGERASLSNNKEQTVNTGKKLWVRGTTAFTVSVHVSA